MKIEIMQPHGSTPEQRVIIKVTTGRNVVAAGSGSTPISAARRLVRHINHVAEETERLVLELGLLTADEIDAIADDDSLDDPTPAT